MDPDFRCRAAVPQPFDLEDWPIRKRAERSFPTCACPACASLCHGVPGIYDPWMAERLLAADPAGFVAATLIDYYEDDEPTFYLRPRNRDDPDVAPPVPSVEPCVHLGPAGCTLARADMPYGCRSAFACEANGCDHGDRWEGRDPRVWLWGGRKGRSVVRRFEVLARRYRPDRAPADRVYAAYQNAMRADWTGMATAIAEAMRESRLRRGQAARRIHLAQRTPARQTNEPI